MAFEPKRVSELDSISVVANDDYYIIVDSSDNTEGIQGKTKKISHADLLALTGAGAINADNIVSGTLADARLSANVTIQGNTFNGNNQLVRLDGSGKLPGSSYGTAVTLKGNTFNGTNQLVQLDGTGKYPSNDGSQITNLNASNISSGEIDNNRIPSIVARNRRVVTPVLTGTGVSLTDLQSRMVFVTSHTTGTAVFNLESSISPGAFFTICTRSAADVLISSTGGLILGPNTIGNISFPGRTTGGRRVEIVCIDANTFMVSGDLT